MKNPRVNPYGIKTPKSVDEFRENLRKYYLTIPHPKEIDNSKGRNDYPIEDYTLNVRDTNGIRLSDISSFSDIYEITKTGFGGNGDSPMICPLVTYEKELTDYMNGQDQFSCEGYFLDESNFKVWDDVNDFLSDGNPKWSRLDNQWLREFYFITLGEFCGYVISETNMEEK